MSPREGYMLERYIKRYGLMKSTEALELAIQAEIYKNDMSYTDPAKAKYMYDMILFERYAILLEKRENHETI